MLAPEGYDYSNNIHLFSMKGLKFALDVNSGAVSVLDDIGFRFLSELVLAGGNLEQARRRCLELACPQEIREAEAELQEARDKGYLFTAQEIPCFAFDEMPVKALCLNVAHKCNLRCRYCFAAQGSFGGEEMLMTSEVGQRAVDFLLANCGQVKNLEIDFFGGEPLLNLDVVKDTVRYGKKCADKLGKTINFTLTTNAVLLTEEIMDFLLAEHIALILSLDGRQEVNDACRVSSSGKGSYDLVLPRIQMAVAKNPHSYYVRGTFTKKNLDFGRDLEHLIECCLLLGSSSSGAPGVKSPRSGATATVGHVLAVVTSWRRRRLWTFSRRLRFSGRSSRSWRACRRMWSIRNSSGDWPVARLKKWLKAN